MVTEAGFGADLGAEKFIDIKCRASGLQPAVVVLVATVRALKYHGGVDVATLNVENLGALSKGIANINKHIQNLQQHFGLQVLVAINHFVSDTEAELALLQAEVAQLGAQAILCKHWAQGGAGAIALAQAVLTAAQAPLKLQQFLYPLEASLLQKIETIAQKMYGASGVALSEQAQATLIELEKNHAQLPVCIAKTQYSFSTDATLRGAPTGHVLQVRALKLARGAGFVVAICGDIMTMPGLPKQPASAHIGVNLAGQITGLS